MSGPELILMPSKADEEPSYDMSQEEDLLVELDDGNVAYVTIISDTSGWCSCERDYGELAYMVEQACEFPDRDGYYVIEGCTGRYTRGAGWMTDDDDDADFYPGTIRPATTDEIAQHL